MFPVLLAGDEGQAPAFQAPYPRKLEDISRARLYLQRATSCSLPEEMISRIFYFAGYDCLHYTACGSKERVGKFFNDYVEPARSVYIETPPLKLNYGNKARAKIRSVCLCASGKDAGAAAGPYELIPTMFELTKRQQGETDSDPLQDRAAWAWNAIGDYTWQHHKFHIEAEKNVDAELEMIQRTDCIIWSLQRFATELKDGDKVSMEALPRGKAGLFRIKDAWIDIEVAIYPPVNTE